MCLCEADCGLLSSLVGSQRCSVLDGAVTPPERQVDVPWAQSNLQSIPSSCSPSRVAEPESCPYYWANMILMLFLMFYNIIDFCEIKTKPKTQIPSFFRCAEGQFWHISVLQLPCPQMRAPSFETCFCSEWESETDAGNFQKLPIRFHTVCEIKSGSYQHNMKHFKTVRNKFRQRFPQGNCSTTLTVSLTFQFSMINRFLTSNQIIWSSYLMFSITQPRSVCCFTFCWVQ